MGGSNFFSAGASVSRLSVGEGSGATGGYDAYVDNVGLTQNGRTAVYDFEAQIAVPEPATWARILGGSGMVGGMMRSKRRRSKCWLLVRELQHVGRREGSSVDGLVVGPPACTMSDSASGDRNGALRPTCQVRRTEFSRRACYFTQLSASSYAARRFGVSIIGCPAYSRRPQAPEDVIGPVEL